MLTVEQIQTVLQKHNPYRFNQPKPDPRIDYAMEAKDLAEKFTDARYGLGREKIDVCVGSTLYYFGTQMWFDGDYFSIADDLLKLDR